MRMFKVFNGKIHKCVFMTFFCDALKTSHIPICFDFMAVMLIVLSVFIQMCISYINSLSLLYHFI